MVANLETVHAKRVTLQVKDMPLAREMRNITLRYPYIGNISADDIPVSYSDLYQDPPYTYKCSQKCPPNIWWALLLEVMVTMWWSERADKGN